METPYEQEGLDSAIEVSLETVKKRAVRGVAILTGRGFLLNGIAQISQLFLLAFLSPAELGTFWIVSAAVAFLIYFSDIGLAAALIQKKEKPSEADLATTFTIQQGLVLALLLVLHLVSPYLVRVYGLTNDGRMLIYALGFSLFLSSLKSIPSVLLERKLNFGRFVLPEILENLCYNLTLVVLAWRGFGVTSFTYAVVVRGLVGVVAIYILQPWMPRIAFNRGSVGRLLKFGVPYQVNTLVSVVKDQGITLILGGILGQAAIGYLGSAMRLSQIPLRLFMDNVTKVSFPAFARLQDRKEELARSVTLSVQFICFLVFPSLIGFMVIAPNLMVILPKYQKWELALLPLYIVSINVIFAAVATQLTNMLMAIGKIRVVIKLTIMYTLLTIIFVPYLASKYDFAGAAWGYALVGVSSVVAIWVAKREVNFSLVTSFFKPLLAALTMGGVIFWVRGAVEPTSMNTLGVILLGGVVYGVGSIIIIGPSILRDGKKILYNFWGK